MHFKQVAFAFDNNNVFFIGKFPFSITNIKPFSILISSSSSRAYCLQKLFFHSRNDSRRIILISVFIGNFQIDRQPDTAINR